MQFSNGLARAEAAFAVGIDDYLRKETEPSHYQVLARRIRSAVEERRAEEALIRSEESFRIPFLASAVLVVLSIVVALAFKEARVEGYEVEAIQVETRNEDKRARVNS
jgi:anti-sigma-K factor RskA